jgi:hypothetical protein
MIKFTMKPETIKLLIFNPMSGFFGDLSKTGFVEDVFYGTDYHSHPGTKRTGFIIIVKDMGNKVRGTLLE